MEGSAPRTVCCLLAVAAVFTSGSCFLAWLLNASVESVRDDRNNNLHFSDIGQFLRERAIAQLRKTQRQISGFKLKDQRSKAAKPIESSSKKSSD